MLFQSIAITAATVPPDSIAAGTYTDRTVDPFREWIFDIVDTAVMALLGLASIVVAVVLDRKQLQATRAQLQIILDTAHRHPRVNHVEMDDLESGQHDLDGKVRSDTSVDPSAQRADSNDFLPEPEPQPHVIPNDQPPTRLRILDTEARRLASEDGFPYNESQKRGDEGQMHEKVMPAAGSCIQLDRQDSQTQDLHGRRRSLILEVWHPMQQYVAKI